MSRQVMPKAYIDVLIKQHLHAADTVAVERTFSFANSITSTACSRLMAMRHFSVDPAAAPALHFR